MPQSPPTSQVGFALPIMQAIKTLIEADPNLKVDGNLGVKSIKITKGIADGSQLILDWSPVGKCPAILIWCEPRGEGKVLSQTDRLQYEVQLGVCVEHNRRLTGGLENHFTILESAVRHVRATIERLSTTFVSGTYLQVLGDGSKDSFTRAARLRRRDIATATIPVSALYSQVLED